MDKSVYVEVNKELNSLDVINDSFLFEKNDNEEEIGVIGDEKTKKLIYYILRVIGKKLSKILNRGTDLFSRYESGENIVIQELTSFDNELTELSNRKEVAAEMLSLALMKYVKSERMCPIYSVKRGWKVVKPRTCNNCFLLEQGCSNIKEKVIPGFEKFKDNYKYN